MNPLNGVQIPALPAPPPATPSLTPVEGKDPSFKNLLLEGIQQVNSMQQEADMAVQQLVTGGDVDPAVVLTAIQKADMSFRMMTQIRNKLVQAYQEVNQIRI